MSRDTYQQCLQRSYQVNWRLEDVLDGRAFDPARRWLPSALSGASELTGFDADARRKLTHVEMAAYAHLFGYAEEFIAPTVVELAHEHGAGRRDAFDAMTQFAAEEVKHMQLFRRLRDRIHADLGVELGLLGDQAATVDFVMSKHRGAVLLLTACIEWLTQRHYTECFEADGDVDPFTRHVFKCHWLEESQHARIDDLETLRTFAALDEAERERAVDDLIDLVAAFDGLLQEQARLDVENFAAYLGRALTADERTRVHEQVLAAKRHTFLVTGITHPRFVALLGEVTTEAQRERIQAALLELLPVLGEAA